MKMKAVLAFAVAVTGAPVLAAPSADDQATSSDRRVCTRVERRGGSRISYQRVCLTQAEWRDRLGPDWRLRLTGRNPEDDVEGADFRSRDQPTTTYQGGLGGPQ